MALSAVPDLLIDKFLEGVEILNRPLSWPVSKCMTSKCFFTIKFARTKPSKTESDASPTNSKELRNWRTLPQKRLGNFSTLVIAIRNRLRKESDCRSTEDRKRSALGCRTSSPNRSVLKRKVKIIEALRFRIRWVLHICFVTGFLLLENKRVYCCEGTRRLPQESYGQARRLGYKEGES